MDLRPRPGVPNKIDSVFVDPWHGLRVRLEGFFLLGRACALLSFLLLQHSERMRCNISPIYTVLYYSSFHFIFHSPNDLAQVQFFLL